MYYSKINISVHGSSAHGSTPHLGKDAIVAASSFILNAQALVSRLNNPLKPLVFTVSGVNGGTQFNIITDLVKMTLIYMPVMKKTLKPHSPALQQLPKAQPRHLAVRQNLNSAKCRKTEVRHDEL